MTLDDPFRGLRESPGLLLAIATLVFIALAIGLGSVRVFELRSTAYDLGLYQQALWTGGHGGGFYESADWELSGYGSLLLVHMAPILFVLSPAYSLAPSPVSLVVLQAALLGAGAAPLYLLGRDRGLSGSGALAIALLYLGWAPLLAGAVFDFHIEALLPLELFGFIWLWGRRAYVAALIPFAATLVTGQFAVAVLVLVGAYLVWSEVASKPREEGDRWRGLWRRLRSRALVPTLAIAPVAIGWGLFLVYLQSMVVAPVFTAGLSAGNPQPPGWNPAAWATGLDIAPANLAVALWAKVSDWVVLFALFGFLPLFSRRWLVLGGPWIAFTLLASSPKLVEPGNQYAFIAVVPLALGALDGWPVLLRLLDGLGRPRSDSYLRPRTHRRWTPPRRAILIVLGLLMVNLALGPLDPALHSDGSLGPGYDLSFAPPPGYSGAAAVADLVPTGAVVLASTDLFPLVANDPNAYVLPGPLEPGSFSHLPFGTAVYPPFVLLSQDRLLDVPAWLAGTVYDPAVYHLRAVAWNTPAGTVLLFEAANLTIDRPDYVGPLPSTSSTFAPTHLAVGSAGALVPAGPNGALVISSIAGAAGTVWYGPYTALAPGRYHVEIDVGAVPWPTAVTPNATTPALEVTIGAFGQSAWVKATVPYGLISPATFGRLIFEVDVPTPSVNVQVVGVQLSTGVRLTMSGLALTAAE